MTLCIPCVGERFSLGQGGGLSGATKENCNMYLITVSLELKKRKLQQEQVVIN